MAMTQAKDESYIDIHLVFCYFSSGCQSASDRFRIKDAYYMKTITQHILYSY